MPIDFKKYAQEGDKFLASYAKELGSRDDMAKAGRILRASLHALRGFLSTEENLQLLAQLPMFLKALYVENWTLKKPKKTKRSRDLLFQVRKADNRSAVVDFESNEEVERAVSVLFIVLRKYVSLGELEDVKALLPKKYKALASAGVLL
ncbi:MAG: hypothetical protein FD123_3465 [Bacteroidetes bacterium]|nr:MAG: hypothetical protein FD123_3465 [Bacteroidota bacterium]